MWPRAKLGQSGMALPSSVFTYAEAWPVLCLLLARGDCMQHRGKKWGIWFRKEFHVTKLTFLSPDATRFRVFLLFWVYHVSKKAKLINVWWIFSLPPSFNACPPTERNIISPLLFECVYEPSCIDKWGGHREEENGPGKGLKLQQFIK